MRPAASILLLEADAIRPILTSLEPETFDNETVLPGWSVRKSLHGFSPTENDVDIVERRGWPIERVLEELFTGYEAAAGEIDRAGGSLDGLGLGEWLHGGDIRDAIDAPNSYTSEGAALAFDLMLDRSAANYRPQGKTSQEAIADKPTLDIVVDGTSRRFGAEGVTVGSLITDLETFMRLTGGRRPDPNRFELKGAHPSDLVLFH
jgi:hypothetical protein